MLVQAMLITQLCNHTGGQSSCEVVKLLLRAVLLSCDLDTGATVDWRQRRSN